MDKAIVDRSANESKTLLLRMNVRSFFDDVMESGRSKCKLIHLKLLIPS